MSEHTIVMTAEQVYNIYRGSYKANPPPAWNDLDVWQQDAMKICYQHGELVGKLMAPKRKA